MWFCAADPLCLEGLVEEGLGKQVSLWWRWPAAEEYVVMVPRWLGAEELEQETRRPRGPESELVSVLGAEQEKWAQW